MARQGAKLIGTRELAFKNMIIPMILSDIRCATRNRAWAN